ncbi:IclR family transcriptional regulator C-terminal domain-containing protein [Variovorax sp. YR216]|uniref:IclR family transcriptional regulator domain-containing protein n=1 Tax=Variovorax sp. YR216 TaxID=1882828 RepID=UPI0008973BCA|nr:IclR family transcriptional regulator C-terminal domain-containing protein [Variovorax sp. YR216]SEB25048.1 transcriptional regulator, IclR family [Variovorax sp. YR216]
MTTRSTAPPAPKSTRSAQSGDGTGALEKALDVLDAVGSSPQGLSQSEVADRLDLPRTTVYRLLATLINRGLLRRDPLRKVYCLGFRCFEMAKQAYAMPDLVAAAAAELRALRDLTGETSYLATLDGREVISLERCDGAHSQRSAAALGERKPLHCTSQGKAILSAMTDEERDAIVRELTLKPLTPLTITDRRRLHAELRIARARGYAIDDEEIVLGVRCVGAPVKDSSGEVRGAISVAGPAWRLTRERLELLGPEVAEAARRIGAQLSSSAALSGNDSESTVRAIPGPWAFHGAHPVVMEHGLVYWADVLAPSVRLWDGHTDREVYAAQAPITGLVRTPDGLAVICESGAVELRPGQEPAAYPWPEGKCLGACAGVDGTIWVAIGLPEAGSAIGQLMPDGRLKIFWRIGEQVAAMCCWGDDGAVFATIPSSGTILMMTPGQGGVKRLATVPRGSGRVGGLTFDDQGGVWTALCDGWSVVRFTLEGQLDRVVGLPVPCATDVAFRREGDCRELVITTQRQSVPLDTLSTAPQSGRLLVATL